MRILRAADRLPTPWKNGGGLTWEVAAWPAGASLSDFEWRASIAEVASAGPFSTFEGVDRVLTVLAGAGLDLKFEDQAPIRLDACSAPFAFQGDEPCAAILVGGAVRDFNIMVRRGGWSAQVQRLAGPGILCTQADFTLVLACAPTVFDGVQLDPNDVALIEGALDADFGPGTLLAAKFTRS